MNTRRHDPNDSEDKVLEAAAARRRSCMEGLAAKLLGVPFGSGDLAAAVMEAGNGLAEAGLTPSRVNLAILTIAPSLDGVGLRWMRAAPGVVDQLNRPWGFLDTPEHRDSPLAVVMQTRKPLRIRLCEESAPHRFPIVEEFLAAGGTDYLALPLPSTRGDVHVLTVMTDAPGGWSADMVSDIQQIVPAMSLVTEVFESKRLTRRDRLELVSLAHMDRLTGIPNRHGLMYDAELLFGEGRPFQVVSIDLDGFKGVNDRLGHRVGDHVIANVAKRLKEAAPAGALVGRMGGDEFVVMAHDDEGLADRIRSVLSETYRLDGAIVGLTASVGVACSPEHGSDLESLVQRADSAMRHSKVAGKNRVSTFDVKQIAAENRAERIVQLLPVALERGEIRIVVQPIVSLIDGKVVRGECLARWLSPELGIVGPDEFVPLAERAGAIRRLGSYVLERVIQVAREQHMAGRNIPLSFNLSGHELVLPDVITDLCEQVRRSGLPRGALMVELTESAFIESYGVAAEHLAALRAIGMSLALDDFGTGYSSLSYLHRLEVDVVKLDRSLVSDLPGTRATALADAVNRLGLALGTQIVAEGVETRAQHDALCAIGTTFAQGYLYSRPLELDSWRRCSAPEVARQDTSNRPIAES